MIQPAFTYSPEGILTIQRAEPEFERGPSIASCCDGGCGDVATRQANPALETRRNRIVGLLERIPGTEASAKQVSIDVPEALELGRDEPHRTANFLLGSVGLIIQDGFPDKGDQVVSVLELGSDKLTIGVYQQFQRWLNDGGFDGQVARRTAIAMAQPLGAEAVAQAATKARYYSLPDSEGIYDDDSLNLSVEVNTDEVVLSKLVAKRSGRGKERLGKTFMAMPKLAYHNSSDLDATPVLTERTLHMRTNGADKSLYSVRAERLSDSRRTLGLFLGVGAMAYEAAQYPGRESAYGSIDWVRRWSKDPTPVAVRH